jgi:hypothetical protein
MPHLKKYIYTGLTALINLSAAIGANALEGQAVTVFAGPQSLSPSEIISVTAQTPPRANISGGETVELTYSADGIAKTRTGTAVHGLISFDIEAQYRAGVMIFSAKASGQTSPEALVTVVPGPPTALSLTIQASRPASVIAITSDVITDSRGNTVSDLSLVSLQWIDATGLIKSQQAQLFNGQISLNAKCPSDFSGELKIQANLKTVQFLSSDISTLCSVRKG